MLAVSPQFVAWNASGLENAYFTLFLCAASLCLIAQLTQPRAYPFSGLFWFLLAITRPEGLAYVLIGGGVGVVWIHTRHGTYKAAIWAGYFVATFSLPFVLWHLWRYQTFAWELPNTYYAKLGETRFGLWKWEKLGWNYIRNFSLITAHGFLIPLYVLGQTGGSGRAPRLGLGLCIFAYLLTLPGLGWLADGLGWFDITWDDPEWLIYVRVGAWGMVLLMTPLLGLRRYGAGPRSLAWAYVTAVLCYTLYVGGDWMAGFRWLSFLIVPLLVLFTDSLETLYRTLEGRRHWLQRGGPTLAAAVAIIAAIAHTSALIGYPETSPYDVRRRVLYIEQIRQQLDLDHITQMEVDMGAHLWWGDAHFIDMAGLADVPMGHHKWERSFVREYVYEEKKPEFAHVHGGWGKKRKCERIPNGATTWRCLRTHRTSGTAT